MTDGVYRQPVKDLARRSAIEHAISSLTKYRDRSCCVNETYVREVREYLLSRTTPYGYDALFAGQLDQLYIDLWEEFHRSHVGSRGPRDLTVAYLCGPEPLNDFEVLVEFGVHPHNIWAFESVPETYNTAVEAIRNSKFPMLKIHKGNIESFFRDTPKKFDIVYLDAKGPLPSRGQKTLRLVATMLKHQRLNSPGALITNFSCPQPMPPFLPYLTAYYLYPKAFFEGFHNQEYDSPVAIEGPECHSMKPGDEKNGDSFLKAVRENFAFYYEVDPSVKTKFELF